MVENRAPSRAADLDSEAERLRFVEVESFGDALVDLRQGRHVAGGVEPVIAQPAVADGQVLVDEETRASGALRDAEGPVDDVERRGEFEVGVGVQREQQAVPVDKAAVHPDARLARPDDADRVPAREPVEVAEGAPLLGAVGAEVGGVETEEDGLVGDEVREAALAHVPVRRDERLRHVGGRRPDGKSSHVT